VAQSRYPAGVRGTTTAVSPDRMQLGFMPDGHRDPDPPPSLRERLTDWRYGFRNTFTGYEVGGVPWADADGAWHYGSAPACLVPGTTGQRVKLGLVRVRSGANGRPGRRGRRLAGLPVAGRGDPSARSVLGYGQNLWSPA
jgi:hypothetical protein